jgi:hypothetical protein
MKQAEHDDPDRRPAAGERGIMRVDAARDGDVAGDRTEQEIRREPEPHVADEQPRFGCRARQLAADLLRQRKARQQDGDQRRTDLPPRRGQRQHEAPPDVDVRRREDREGDQKPSSHDRFLARG